MKYFGWWLWGAVNRLRAKNKGMYGRERTLLMLLHDSRSLTQLARSIKNGYPGSSVRVQSIWVDGTPQAEFKTMAGETKNCEFADLLLIVRYQNSTGQITEERGIALQVKISDKYNALPGGESTKLERALLEDMDRSHKLELYSATSRHKSSFIGSYDFGTGAIKTGLKDVARYTNFPKNKPWFSMGIAPLQVGWPKSYTNKFFSKPIGFVEAIQRLASGKIGRDIFPVGPSDPWAEMVSDLRGSYAGVQMNGYNGQNRINISKMMRYHVGGQFLTSSKGARSKGFWMNCAFADDSSWNVFSSINKRNENIGLDVEGFDPAISMIIITFAEKNPLANQNPES
ncbi:MAG: hypothetical protein ACRC02_08305 [Vogesella sp.]|uniref:hypothetical protein n=1 Tax=Vogesella sp. TaxID=1904252 RepID=UPI003F3CB6E0